MAQREAGHTEVPHLTPPRVKSPRTGLKQEMLRSTNRGDLGTRRVPKHRVGRGTLPSNDAMEPNFREGF